MRWGILILLVLGLVAAGSAALLVTTMQARSETKQPVSDSTDVIVLNRDLGAMVVVSLNDLDKKSISREEIPPGAITDMSLAVGRVLSVPVIEGQILTGSCFISQGTGAQLAAALPDGMRAVTVYLGTQARPDSLLLYPGCVVDVLFTTGLSGDERGQAMSATILRGIQVLAVQGESVVSNPEAEEGSTAGQARSQASGSAQVTLLLDTKQAEALQLALKNGTISLTVRNPLDKQIGEMDATIYNQQDLALFGSAMTIERLSETQQQQQQQEEMRKLLEMQQEEMRALLESMIPDFNQLELRDSNDADMLIESAMSVNTNLQETASSQSEVIKPKQSPSPWDVTVISGRSTITEEFLLQDGKGSEAD